jgi:hypothetical protein
MFPEGTGVEYMLRPRRPSASLTVQGASSPEGRAGWGENVLAEVNAQLLVHDEVAAGELAALVISHSPRAIGQGRVRELL